MAKKRNDLGAELERRVARVEFAEGALARTRMIVPDPFASAGRDVLTDLDVVALDFDSRLRHTFSILECKSGRGQAQEADRLFWLTGVKTYVRADRGVLVRESVSNRGRTIARRLGLETFDAVTLARREQENAWVPPRFGHIGGPSCEALEQGANKQLKAIGEFPPELGRFLAHDALRSPAHVALGQLAKLSELGSRIVLPHEAGLVVAGHSLVGVVFAALRVASWLDSIPSSEAATLIARGVTAGDTHDTRSLELLESADAYYQAGIQSLHADYVDGGAKRSSVDVPPLAPQIREPPDWLGRFVDLAERLRANAPISRLILQTLELAVFDALAGDDAWKVPAFDHLFTPEHKNLVVVAQTTLEAIIGTALANHVKGVGELPYDRTPPALPDRRTPLIEAEDENSAEKSDGKLFENPLS